MIGLETGITSIDAGPGTRIPPSAEALDLGTHLMGWSPHPGQLQVLQSDARFRIVVAGRRWGKSKLAARLCLFGLPGQPGLFTHAKRLWVVAPTYALTEEVWREIEAACLKPAIQAQVKQLLHGEMRVELSNGARLDCKSADNPDSLLSVGLDGLVIDEAARVPDIIWQQYLRPTLTDRQGWALFISTPRAKGSWFYRAYARGQDPVYQTQGWRSWQFHTADNPHLPPVEIELAKSDMPESIYATEYLGQFMEGAGAVFRNIAACVAGEVTRPAPGAYVIGCDFGRQVDFSVFTVLDIGRRPAHVVALDRMNTVPYTLQLERLAQLAQTWRPRLIIAESNGVGDPLIDQLQRLVRGVRVQGFQTTASSKLHLVEGLALAMEHRWVSFPPDPVLLSELESFEYATLPSGQRRYSAPAGLHDDCVVSLALAWHALQSGLVGARTGDAGDLRATAFAQGKERF